MLLQDMERSPKKESNQVGSSTGVTMIRKQQVKIEVKEEKFESWLGSFKQLQN